MALHRPEVRRDSLKIPVKPEFLTLIDRAAALIGKSRTVLKAATHAAQNSLFDGPTFLGD